MSARSPNFESRVADCSRRAPLRQRTLGRQVWYAEFQYWKSYIVKKTYEDGTTKNDKRREREKAQALLLRTVYCLSQEREQWVGLYRVAIDDNEKNADFVDIARWR